MRKHNYLVGYRGEGQCVYGRAETDSDWNDSVDLLTLFQAKQRRKKLLGRGGKIYKLVELKEVKK